MMKQKLNMMLAKKKQEEKPKVQDERPIEMTVEDKPVVSPIENLKI